MLTIPHRGSTTINVVEQRYSNKMQISPKSPVSRRNSRASRGTHRTMRFPAVLKCQSASGQCARVFEDGLKGRPGNLPV